MKNPLETSVIHTVLTYSAHALQCYFRTSSSHTNTQIKKIVYKNKTRRLFTI